MHFIALALGGKFLISPFQVLGLQAIYNIAIPSITKKE
ncbi:hypothetical protein B4167_1311 [Caldibacillus thermoamylovorans]|uniref:Uncharacterized protein n=1 Tax=Caldibacillus thermoamylovorans TaxID=35841 RepID=A0ABD4A2V5_9BACI|nr:hypothetical protein B4167_1311 [Caldibacillus thermoamylovorans]